MSHPFTHQDAHPEPGPTFPPGTSGKAQGRWEVPAAAALSVLLLLSGATEAGPGKRAKRHAGTRGVVTSVDGAARSFTRRAGKKGANAGGLTVRFDDHTRFQRRGQGGRAEAKSSDLKARSRVAVVYQARGGQNVATRVTFLDRGKKKKG